MLMGRMDHAMVSHNNRLYVFGGYDKNIIKAFDRDTIDSYDMSQEQWSTIKTNCPKMSSIYACLIGPKVYIVGGFSYDENKKHKDVTSYDLERGEWETVARIHSPAMSIPSCVLRLPRQMLRRCNSSSHSTV